MYVHIYAILQFLYYNYTIIYKRIFISIIQHVIRTVNFVNKLTLQIRYSCTFIFYVHHNNPTDFSANVCLTILHTMKQ